MAVRYGRMLESPFSFYRGAPLVMASDLSHTPSTGIQIQICGDAHLLNFGTYATPERNVIFDVNDFDETHVGPWEWDIKRLAASIVVAARTTGLADVQGVEAVHRASAEYRSTMSTLAELSPFEVWHSHIDVDAIVAAAPTRPARAEVQKVVAKARRRTSLQALSKMTTVVDGKRVIVEDPPLVTRLTSEEVEQARRFADAYRRRLDPDRRLLLDRYEFVDAARKVVGVGSVGTRCFIVLLAAAVDLDPLFLQIKEAQPSVLAPFVGRSSYTQPGSAGRGRSTGHAGGQRRVPRVGSGRRVRRLCATATRHERVGPARRSRPERPHRLREAVRRHPRPRPRPGRRAHAPRRVHG